MLRFIFGTLAFIGSLALVFVIEGGNPIHLLLLSPLVIVICVPCFALLAVWSLKDWGHAWKDAFSLSKGEAKARSLVSAKIWDFYEKTSYIAGIVGFFLGLTLILMQLADPSKMGPALAAALTSPILGIVFALIARILKARVENSSLSS